MSISLPPASLKYLNLSAKKRKVNASTSSGEMSEMGEIVLQLLANKNQESASGNKKNDSATSSGSDDEESFGIKSVTSNMHDYLDFIKIRPSKKDTVFDILDKNDITSFKFFKAKSITHENMSKWGLSDGIITQLRENVTHYERHLQKK